MAKSGGVLLAIAEGAITEDDVRTELGHVIVGARRGRSDPTTTSRCSSPSASGCKTLPPPQLVMARAAELGVGTTVDLSALSAGGGILETVDSVLHFAGNFWWLIFPLGGVIGGGVRAVAAANERRAERRLERYRIKQQTKVAVAEASGRGKVDEAAARREMTEGPASSTTATDARWLDYEMDVAKLLDFPMMTDMRAAADRRRSTGPAAAPTCCGPPPPTTSSATGTRSSTTATPCTTTSPAFDVAEAEAIRRRRSDFSAEAQERLERAQRLLRVASDDAATADERRTPTPRRSANSTGSIVLPAVTRAGDRAPDRRRDRGLG